MTKAPVGRSHHNFGLAVDVTAIAKGDSRLGSIASGIEENAGAYARPHWDDHAFSSIANLCARNVLLAALLNSTYQSLLPRSPGLTSVICFRIV